MTTLKSYGEVACQLLGETMLGLVEPEEAKQTDADEISSAFIKKLCESGLE